MKRLFFCLSALLIVGCMPSEPEISASQLAAKPENQTRHYRPVHRTQNEWTISQIGNTITVYADTRVKLSARRNPHRVLIRESGNLIGQIEQKKSTLQYVAFHKDYDYSLEFQCIKHHEAQLTTPKGIQSYYLTNTGAENTQYELTKQPARRRYSIATSPLSDAESCVGTELDSPFNAFGTLIFQDDALPLHVRAAFAWHLTYFKQTCE